MTIPAGHAQVNLRFTGASIPTGAEVTFGVDAEFISDPEQIGEKVLAAIGESGCLAPLSNTIDLSTILVKVGPDETGPSAEIPSETGGGTAGNCCPPNVAVLIRKNTSFGGRKGAGRLYLPGVIETVVGDDGVLDTAFRTGLQADWGEFMLELASETIPMMLLHADATPPYVVNSLNVQARAATQRRRLRR